MRVGIKEALEVERAKREPKMEAVHSDDSGDDWHVSGHGNTGQPPPPPRGTATPTDATPNEPKSEPTKPTYDTDNDSSSS